MGSENGKRGWRPRPANRARGSDTAQGPLTTTKSRVIVVVGAVTLVVAIVVGLRSKPGPVSTATGPMAADGRPISASEAPGGLSSPGRTTAGSSSVSKGPYSNIDAEDYVGPEVCRKCHLEQYERWRTHPHSKMNLDSSSDTVVGDFSGKSVDYAGGTAVFEEQAGDFFMTLSRQGEGQRYKVTRTVGSRFQQMYIGTLTQGPQSSQVEVKLPFGYWVGRKQWFATPYFESDIPDEYSPDGKRNPVLDLHRPTHFGGGFGDWNGCIWCHNTFPYVKRLQRSIVTGKPFSGFPQDNLSLSTPRHPTPRGQPLLQASDLIVLGITCESCHFGGREHALEQREIRFLPSSPDLTFPRATPELIASARQSSYVINAICSQCHSADSSSYPNGASIDNSREALDLQSGACASEIKCTDCHDPHRPGPTVGRGPSQQAHLDACLRCHDKYQGSAAATAHSGHEPANQVSCLDCHMPRIVSGLTDVIRTHQISSPTDPRMFEGGAPNACNLCHLDRSLDWTLQALKSIWRSPIPTASSNRAYRMDLNKPTGVVWLESNHAIVRKVAVDAYSRSPLGKVMLPDLLSILNDTHASNRMYGLMAIEEILGRQLDEKEYAPMAAPARRARQVRSLTEELKSLQ